MLESINCAILIPTYNNSKTLQRVLDGVLQFGNSKNVVVVNDGSTDTTVSILESYSERLNVISYTQNQGKGYALKKGFEWAINHGFDHVITIDSDGQHLPSDIPAFIELAQKNTGALLMGSRNLNQEGVPAKNSFGNKFSNFWFKVDTGIDLPDTQTGFRLYPLAELKKLKIYTNKFEAELEMLVKMAWSDVKIIPIPIQVIYDPTERVTHFRPARDFTRISILNTWFFILAVLWYIPKRVMKKLFQVGVWNTIKAELYNQDQSILRKSLSVGFGLFMGIFPIWGFQLLVGMTVAVAAKLNKVLVFLAANISIPPMIPLIIYGSFKMGEPFFPNSSVFLTNWSEFNLETIQLHVAQYLVGAVLLSLLMGIFGVVVSYFFLSFNKSESK